MTTLDILYLSLAGGFIILVAGISFLIYHLIGTIKILQKVLSEVEDTTHDVQTVKNTLKYGGLAAFTKVLSLISKRL